MSTTLLDHKQIIMTIENLKINDLTDDPSRRRAEIRAKSDMNIKKT